MLQKRKEQANKAQKDAGERAKAGKNPGRPIVKPKPRLIKRKVEDPKNPPKKRQKKLSLFFSSVPKK